MNDTVSHSRGVRSEIDHVYTGNGQWSELLQLLDRLLPTSRVYADLSFEIIQSIAYWIDQTRLDDIGVDNVTCSLMAFSMVNVEAREAAVPYIFRRIHCRRFKSLNNLLEISHSRFPKYIQSLSISAETADVMDEVETVHACMETSIIPSKYPSEWRKVVKKTRAFCRLLPGLAAAISSPESTTFNSMLPAFRSLVSEVWSGHFHLALRDLFGKTNFLVTLQLERLDKHPYYTMPYSILPLTSHLPKPLLNLRCTNLGTSRILMDISQLQTLHLEYPFNTTHTSLPIDMLAHILSTIHMTLENLVLIYGWHQTIHRATIVGSPDEIVEWANLKRLKIVSTYVDDGAPPLLISGIMCCPQLQTLSVNHEEHLLNIITGSRLQQLDCTNVDVTVLQSRASGFKKLQRLRMITSEAQTSEFYSKLLSSFPHLATLELELQAVIEGNFDLDSMLIRLSFGYLEAELCTLHDRLERIIVMDQKHSFIGWSWSVAVLRRIFPTLKRWNGFRVSEEA